VAGSPEAPRGSDAAAERRCDACSLCCTVLRVDALSKLGGLPCRHLGPPGTGCGIHTRRPGICRAYRCLWLQGGLEDGQVLVIELGLGAAGPAPQAAVRAGGQEGVAHPAQATVPVQQAVGATHAGRRIPVAGVDDLEP